MHSEQILRQTIFLDKRLKGLSLHFCSLTLLFRSKHPLCQWHKEYHACNQGDQTDREEGKEGNILNRSIHKTVCLRC